MIQCKRCSKENGDDANFCVTCGNKLKEICACWLKKGSSYNCGKSSCPGKTINQMRAEHGLLPIENGDDFFIEESCIRQFRQSKEICNEQ